MKRYICILAALLVVAAALASPSPVTAQERVIVEERSATVLKKIGRTVFLRNDLGEIKKYSELPENVTLYIDGKEANIDDLREGMTLRGVRWVNVPPPAIVTIKEVPVEAAPAPAPAPAPEPAPAPAPEPAPPAPPAELPSTASSLPFIGLIGVLLALLGGGTLLRRRTA